MTLILDDDLDITTTYLHTKMKFVDQAFQKLEPQQDRQTDTQTDATKNITTLRRIRER